MDSSKNSSNLRPKIRPHFVKKIKKIKIIKNYKNYDFFYSFVKKIGPKKRDLAI